MRLIPVMDLKDGLVVHAVRGERQRYQPVKSVLCPTAQPLDVALAFRDQLGLSELYIADLDAIQGSGDHRSLIAALVSRSASRRLMVSRLSCVFLPFARLMASFTRPFL